MNNQEIDAFLNNIGTAIEQISDSASDRTKELIVHSVYRSATLKILAELVKRLPETKT